jgi:hypothetical protein|tara:strand:+ start:596 stop:1024 length:429 start_codon:yes stop_codon:yes gene_type:complete
MNAKKIGWQKYESVIEDQISSPMLQSLIQTLNPPIEILGESDISYEDMEALQRELETDKYLPEASASLAVTEELLSQISMLANFDCWVGHTNFNITNSIKKALEESEGVEILKLTSRYRFFIGVGRMFDFTDVRRDIEEKLC